MNALDVRDATTADAAACAAVYAPYVRSTAASFETEPPSVDEVARRIAAARATHAWLVAERDGELVGYAYATAYKPRPAYRWTCETSVYVARTRRVAASAARSTPRCSTGSRSAASGRPWPA